MLAPEAPYPLHGGGAYRTASLLHYFARFADVDLILMSEGGRPALLPPGLITKQTVIPLPVHGRGTLERYLRNGRRAVAGVPPLTDRFSGLGAALLRALAGTRYDVGIVEHSWCAGYVPELSTVCERTVLDLHNVESVLHERCAAANRGLVAIGHRRFARMSRKLESQLFPQYSVVLAASRQDAARAAEIAPAARIEVYPNAIPWVEKPRIAAQRVIAFSGNFEYHPNIDAVRFLTREIWPEIRRRHPELRLRLIGRGRRFVDDGGIEATGRVVDAFSEIAAAAVVVAPLRVGSGTRIKILEAWAACRPVVATPLAAEGLDASHGHDIILARTAAEFADAVDRLLADAELAKRIGDAGRLNFESNYTWDAAWRALALYLQLKVSMELNRYTG
jgi:glycosyltransferase involved in cell wall biosynthesis